MATDTHAGQLVLRWTDNSSNEAGFEIERKTGTAGRYAAITTLGPDVTTYVDPALTAGIPYCYRVRAFNSAGYSAYSNEACNTATPPPVESSPGEPPPASGWPVVRLVSADSAGATYSVTWRPPAEQPDGPPATYDYTAGYDDGSATQTGTTAATALALTMAYHASRASGRAYFCVSQVDRVKRRSPARCNGFTVPAGGPAVAASPTTSGWPVVRLLAADSAGATYSVTWGPPAEQPDGPPAAYSFTAGYNDGSGAQTGTAATTALMLTMAYHPSGSPGQAYFCVSPVDRVKKRGAARCNGFTVPAGRPTDATTPGWPVVRLVSADSAGATYNVTWRPPAEQPDGPPAAYSYTAGYNDGSGLQTGTAGTTAVVLTMAYHASGSPGQAYICVTPADRGKRAEARCHGFTVPAGRPTDATTPGWPVVRLVSADSAGATYSVTWDPPAEQADGTPAAYSYTAAYNDGSGLQTGTAGTTAVVLTMAYHAGGSPGHAYICVTPADRGKRAEPTCNGFTVPAGRPTDATRPGWPVVSLVSADATGATYSVTWKPWTDRKDGTPAAYGYTAGYDDGYGAQTGTVTTTALTLSMAYHATGTPGPAYVCVTVADRGKRDVARCNGFTVPARAVGDAPAPPLPGRPIATLVSGDATGIRYHVAWSPSTDQQTGTPVPSYSYAAGYNDGSAARKGTVAATTLMLTMPYHARAMAREAFVCVTALDRAGRRSEAACNGFRVPGSADAVRDASKAAKAGKDAGPVPPAVTLKVARAGIGSGTVTSTPAGMACNTSCSISVPAGTRLTLTATPVPGSVFAGWTEGPCRGADVCTLTLAAATTVTATFDRHPSELPTQLVTAAGAGNHARVRGFTATGTATLTDFLAYGPEYTDGLFLAVGRLGGLADLAIVTGTGAGSAGEVSVFRNNDAEAVLRFSPYGPDFSGGVRVALCDVKGDGGMEIVTVPGPGRPATVTVWTVNGAAVSKRLTFPVAPPRYRGGLFVACADINGDGTAEIVTGLDAGDVPEVAVFTVQANQAVEVVRFSAHDAAFTGGVRVAAADLDGDGRAEVLTGLGPGGEPLVGVFRVGPSGVSPVARFHGCEGSFTGGVFVAGGARESGRGRLFVSPGPGAEPVVRVYALVGTVIAEVGHFLGTGTSSPDGATIGVAP